MMNRRSFLAAAAAAAFAPATFVRAAEGRRRVKVKGRLHEQYGVENDWAAC